jgi:tRNA-Thr(GGU) m(6)t(6)A37 methyltransferase TsaA
MLERLRRLWGGEEEGPGPLPEVSLRPIGVVRNGVRQPRAEGWEGVESRIVLRRDLSPALLGLADYSHVIVVFWLHLVPEELRGGRLQLHPRDDPRYPLQGVLATRSQSRPNPLGVAAVPLLAVRGHVLRVRGLDAVDGTPVLDIKPYIPHYDAVPAARIPAWADATRGTG